MIGRDILMSWDAILGSGTESGAGRPPHVNELDEYGRLGTGRCFVPLGGLAQGDVMLAQKIALETDENRALSIANSFPGPLGWRLPRRRPADARSSGVRLSPS